MTYRHIEKCLIDRTSDSRQEIRCQYVCRCSQTTHPYRTSDHNKRRCEVHRPTSKVDGEWNEYHTCDCERSVRCCIPVVQILGGDS
jgi:hypothetical protein